MLSVLLAIALTVLGTPASSAYAAESNSASASDEIMNASEEQASYNAVANLSGAFGDMGTLYANAGQGADASAGMIFERTQPNAQAAAGDGEVTLTLAVADNFSVGSLSGCDNATAEANADGTVTFHLKDASGTYEFSSASATAFSAFAAESMTLKVDLSASGIDLDAVFAKAEKTYAPSSSVKNIDPGVYKVAANMYVVENETAHFLNSTRDGNVAAGDTALGQDARLFVTEDGQITLAVWTDESYTFDSLGTADGAKYEFRDGKEGFYQENAHSYVNFTLDSASGLWKFKDASVSKDGKSYDEVYLAVDFANLAEWSEGNNAVSSGYTNKLDPGTYEVTANLYVPGAYNPKLIGINAFMTSSAFPPTTPVTDNATLTVAEDGSLTLDVDIPCEMFTLKKISGGAGIRVLESTMDDETHSSSDSGYSTVGRITHLKLALDDTSTGFWYFNDCEEYPLPFGETWNLNMYLKVDLANAHVHQDPVAETYEKTLTDESGNYMVYIATKDSDLASRLDGAKLVAKAMGEGDDTYAAIRTELASTFTNWSDGIPSVVYSASVVDADGSAIDLSAYETVKWALSDPDTLFNPPSLPKLNLANCGFCFSYSADGLERIEGASKNYSDEFVFPYGAYYWDSASEGTFVVVSSVDYETGSQAFIPFTFNLFDEATGVSGSFDARDGDGASFSSSSKDVVEFVVDADSSGERAKQAESAISATLGLPYADCSVSAYAPSVIRKSGGAMYYLTGNTAIYDGFEDATATYGFPSGSTEAQLYFVNVDAEGNVSASLASDAFPFTNTSVSDGKVCATWNMAYEDSSDKKNADNVFKALWRGATGDKDGEGYAYFAVVSNNSASSIAATPKAVEDLTYTGAEQTGVSEGEGYTVEGGSAIDAGKYQATAKLKDGYVWSDDSKDDKTIEWSISKAKLTATYAGEQVMRGSDPVYAVGVEGFVNNETILTAADFKMPAIADADKPAASELVGGFSKELTPSGGSARNYEFSYVGGTLKVVAAAGELKPGTYTVTANLYVPGELNTQLPGVTAYLTNASTPLTDGKAPTTPASKNATLVVADDGTATLELDVVNPVFTLQKISGGANATATVSGYGESVGASDSAYAKRISKLSVKLDDTSGKYVFSDCVEYPTLLSTEWTVPLTLEVDLSGIPAADKIVKVDAPEGATLTYSGSEQTGVAAGEGYELSGDAKATKVGTYKATATLKDGYVWSDGSSEPKTIEWSISAKQVAAPAGAQLTYTGSEQTGVAADEGYELSGDAKATKVGTYTATAPLKEGYVWSDGSSEPKTIEWSIAEAKAADPKQDSGNGSGSGNASSGGASKSSGAATGDATAPLAVALSTAGALAAAACVAARRKQRR